ncbi:hypothetical protein AR325_27015 (plasmid) [Serratia marcescens]|nr:hypothetical protein AR325_27015 [Serratia marcescens]
MNRHLLFVTLLTTLFLSGPALSGVTITDFHETGTCSGGIIVTGTPVRNGNPVTDLVPQGARKLSAIMTLDGVPTKGFTTDRYPGIKIDRPGQPASQYLDQWLDRWEGQPLSSGCITTSSIWPRLQMCFGWSDQWNINLAVPPLSGTVCARLGETTNTCRIVNSPLTFAFSGAPSDLAGQSLALPIGLQCSHQGSVKLHTLKPIQLSQGLRAEITLGGVNLVQGTVVPVPHSATYDLRATLYGTAAAGNYYGTTVLVVEPE